MKIKLLQSFIFITLLVTIKANAQYNGSNYGLDRSIDAHNRYSKPKESKPIDFVKASTESLSKNLNLDGFQEAIIRTHFEDYKNAITSINDEQIPNQAKSEKMQIEMDKLDRKIEEQLNKEQKVKFKEFKNKASKKKKKNDKKNKKDDTEEVETSTEEK